MKKNGILTLEVHVIIFFLFRDTFTFLHYVNEESTDDIILNSSTKLRLKHWIRNISRTIRAMFFTLGPKNMYIIKETKWHLLYRIKQLQYLQLFQKCRADRLVSHSTKVCYKVRKKKDKLIHKRKLYKIILNEIISKIALILWFWTLTLILILCSFWKRHQLIEYKLNKSILLNKLSLNYYE